jgi:hypothetical protein
VPLNFADPGVWCWQIVNIDYNRVKAIKEAGFSWVALQIVTGKDGVVVSGNYRDFIDSARSLGLDVAGFGWAVDSPVLEAEKADQMLDFWGLDGYILNGEQPIGYTQTWGQCPDCFGYSSKWCDRWLQIRPEAPLAFSSYGIFSNHDIHYVPWIEAGAAAMPQTYGNEFPWMMPSAGVIGAMDVRQPWNGPPFGWPEERIHPTYANYKSGEKPIPSPREYAESQLLTSARGFSVYLGELISPAEFAQYKLLIPSLSAAAKDPLTEEQLPYTGPFYGPTDGRQPRRGSTVKALKRALGRMGHGTFTSPDDRYNLKLEAAMHQWQKKVGISPASGQYGKGSYNAMRGAFAPDGTHAMDAVCISWVKDDVRG